MVYCHSRLVVPFVGYFTVSSNDTCLIPSDPPEWNGYVCADSLFSALCNDLMSTPVNLGTA